VNDVNANSNPINLTLTVHTIFVIINSNIFTMATNNQGNQGQGNRDSQNQGRDMNRGTENYENLESRDMGSREDASGGSDNTRNQGRRYEDEGDMGDESNMSGQNRSGSQGDLDETEEEEANMGGRNRSGNSDQDWNEQEESGRDSLSPDRDL
jgi:hypothetical protein